MELLTIILLCIIVALAVPWGVPLLLLMLAFIPVLITIAIVLPILFLGTLFGSKICYKKMREVIDSKYPDFEDDEDDHDDDCCTSSITINGKPLKCDLCGCNANSMSNKGNRCAKHG